MGRGSGGGGRRTSRAAAAQAAVTANALDGLSERDQALVRVINAGGAGRAQIQALYDAARAEVDALDAEITALKRSTVGLGYLSAAEARRARIDYGATASARTRANLRRLESLYRRVEQARATENRYRLVLNATEGAG